jgi:hypothetical protein
MIETTIELRKLAPSEGCVLTNGKDYSKDPIYLAVTDKAENWHEITDAEYEAILAEKEKEENANV